VLLQIVGRWQLRQPELIWGGLDLEVKMNELGATSNKKLQLWTDATKLTLNLQR
jgi:hypothetical protein